MTDEEFLVAMELRSIPQRNNNVMILHGDKANVADRLVGAGLAVCGGDYEGNRAFRLNKKGRDALLDEWCSRGRPKSGVARTDKPVCISCNGKGCADKYTECPVCLGTGFRP